MALSHDLESYDPCLAASGWSKLGSQGGGKVNQKRYKKQDCFLQALHLKADDADTWIALGDSSGVRQWRL